MEPLLSERTSNPLSESEGAHEPFVRAVRSHPILVVVLFVLAIAVSVLVAQTRSVHYETSSQVLVSPIQSGVTSYAGLPVVNDDASDPVRPFQTAASLLSSRAADTSAAATLGGSWTQRKVSDAIDVLPQGESNIIDVTGTASSAAAAARLTNVYTTAALSTHRAALEAQAKTLVAQLVAQQQALPATDTADLSTIATQLIALRAVAAGHDPNFSLTESAPVPIAATGTSKKLIVVLGALVGLIVAIGVATVIERLNKRLRDEDEILAEYPLSVIGRIPDVPGRVRTVGVDPSMLPPSLQEAYRTLQVQLPPHQGRARTIMFTSPSPGDGKTSSAINLAVILSTAGFDVALLDFDLRKPDVSHSLGRYTDFLDSFRSNRPLSKLLVPAQPGSRLSIVSSRPGGDVMPLLEAVSRRLPDMLSDLEQHVDYIIIDTAPLGRVSDALRAAPLVEDLILVCRVGSTDRNELRRTRELLERMGHLPTGMVLLGAEDTAGYATYGYGYGPGPNDTDDTDSTDAAAPSSGTVSGPASSKLMVRSTQRQR